MEQAIQERQQLQQDWNNNPRWSGITRDYSAKKSFVCVVVSKAPWPPRCRKLWYQLTAEHQTGRLQCARSHDRCKPCNKSKLAYVRFICQVGKLPRMQTSPVIPTDQSCTRQTRPQVVRRINNALMRADQIDGPRYQSVEDYLVPIIADTEAGFGGPLNAYNW